MAVYAKSISANDMKNGVVTVCNGNNTQNYFDASRGQSWASGDSLNTSIVLNGRYKVAPSGWNA